MPETPTAARPAPPQPGTTPSGLPPRRQRFPGPRVPGAALMLRLLLAQDGSMTRLCEALAGRPVQLHLSAQRSTHGVPAQVQEGLRARHFIERISSLVLDGEVLTDNLVYVALDGLDPALRDQLQAGGQPIGHLIAGRWARRDTLRAGPGLLAPLWHAVGQVDPDATRCYTMHTPEGPPMLICETFRHGLWAQAHAGTQPEREPGGAAA
ncbi:MAG: hypothetical protein Q8K45_22225 [Rubrivivax sp.]|nr:hypothetical protein [Rubrivivax sp.]